MIPNDVQDPSTGYNNMATQYGDISIKKIRALENIYIDTPLIEAQNFHMMYKCTINSLSEEEKQGEYIVGGLLSMNPKIRTPPAQSSFQGVTIGYKLNNFPNQDPVDHP